MSLHPVWAAEQEREKWFAICSDLSSIGHAVMVARQAGMTEEHLIQSARGNQNIEDLIRSAYKLELSETKASRGEQANDFRNGIYKRCSDGAPFS